MRPHITNDDAWNFVSMIEQLSDELKAIEAPDFDPDENTHTTAYSLIESSAVYNELKRFIGYNDMMN